MNRNVIEPRAGWQKIVEDLGLEWHTVEGETGPEKYWNESAYYEFTMREVDAIERATADLWTLALDAIQHVIDEDRFDELALPEDVRPLIIKSWNEEPPALHARFDFSMQHGIPKMLEINGDTPTSLLEASVIQWDWLQAKFPQLDQFNNIHELLVAKWRDVKPYLNGPRVHFTAFNAVEDLWTIAYLAHTASLAGIAAEQLQIQEIGWNEVAGEFRDLAERKIGTLYALYPKEFIVTEPFFEHVARSDTLWIEPWWRMVLANKGLLPILWELNPGHPNLLEATFDAPTERMWGWAKKPLMSREGAAVTLKSAEAFLQSTPSQGYGDEGYIYQALAMLPEFEKNYAVVGSWAIDGAPAGIGVRESDGPITGNASRFVPHLIRG